MQRLGGCKEGNGIRTWNRTEDAQPRRRLFLLVSVAPCSIDCLLRASTHLCTFPQQLLATILVVTFHVSSPFSVSCAVAQDESGCSFLLAYRSAFPLDSRRAAAL